MDITQNLWMLLILPLFAVLFICIPSNCVSIPKRRITLGLTLFASGLSLILTLFFGHRLLQMPGEIFESNFLFLNAGTFKIHIGVLLDNISAFMLLILYITAICTQIFSYKYLLHTVLYILCTQVNSKIKNKENQFINKSRKILIWNR